jgi:hypothetical protein
MHFVPINSDGARRPNDERDLTALDPLDNHRNAAGDDNRFARFAREYESPDCIHVSLLRSTGLRGTMKNGTEWQNSSHRGEGVNGQHPIFSIAATLSLMLALLA